MKKYLLPLFFLFPFQSLFAQNIHQFHKSTFTVLPFVSYVKDTLFADTSTISWKKLSDESINSLEVKRNLINTDLFLSKKYFYTHTNTTELRNLEEDYEKFEIKKDLYSLFEFKENKNEGTSGLETLSRFGTREFYIDSADVYANYIQKVLENSKIPGEMMYLWTNRDILKYRVRQDVQNPGIITGQDIDEFSFEYYKELLEKNYIVVLHTVNAEKYNFTSSKKLLPSVGEKLKNNKQEKTADFAKEKTGLSKIGSLLKAENKSDTVKIIEEVSEKAKEKDKTKFVKAYIFKIILDDKISTPLSKTPREIPPSANLEFIAKIVINEPNLDANRESDFYLKEAQENNFFYDYEKDRENEFYKEIEQQIKLLMVQGEFKCAQESLNSLFEIKNYENKSFADSLIKVCQNALTKNPIYNELKWNKAENIQKQDKELFRYQTACNVPNFKEFKAEQTNTQGGINAVLDVLEKNNPDFLSVSTVSRVEKNKYTSQLSSGNAVYLDQQYSAIRFVNKNDKILQKKIGTLKVTKVGVKNDAGNTRLTEMALVDGSKLDESTVIVEYNDAGTSLLAGYGYKFNDNAISIGFEGRPGKIFKTRMPISGIKLGVNYTINTSRRFRWDTFETYLPSFLDLSLSREFYLTKFFDIKPYASLGYGGEWKKDSEYSYFVPSIGLALPINITGKYLKTKIKLMPDMSLALNWKPQIGILTKIDF